MVKKKQKKKKSAFRLRRNNSKSDASNDGTFNIVRKKLWKNNIQERKPCLMLPTHLTAFYPMGSFSNKVTSYGYLLLPIDNSLTKSLESYSRPHSPERKRRKWKPHPEKNPEKFDSTRKENNCLRVSCLLFSYFGAPCELL